MYLPIDKSGLLNSGAWFFPPFFSKKVAQAQDLVNLEGGVRYWRRLLIYQVSTSCSLHKGQSPFGAGGLAPLGFGGVTCLWSLAEGAGEGGAAGLGRPGDIIVHDERA